MASANEARKPIKKTIKGEEKMPEGEKPRAIMVKPLPQILDEIEDSIVAADEAAKNARQAAEEARRAGEKAATEAARVAAEAIGRVEQVAKNALKLAELINSALIEAATGLDKKLKTKQ